MERPKSTYRKALPSSAIEQKPPRAPAFHVGTITEIYDYLRVIYSAIGVPHCPDCGKPSPQSSEQIVQAILMATLQADDRIMILPHRPRTQRRLSQGARKTGARWYVRVRIDGELYPSTPQPPRQAQESHHRIVIDRLLVKQGIASRSSIHRHRLKLAAGLVTVSLSEARTTSSPKN